jgi:hypothetical protein
MKSRAFPHLFMGFSVTPAVNETPGSRIIRIGIEPGVSLAIHGIAVGQD